jgi:phospholipid/cholesterol/gamma-HCH transport system substrate-binding protein
MRRDLRLSGAFVLAMLLVALTFMATLLPGFWPSSYWLVADFLDARGLEEGTRVVQQGYVIGLVERIEPIFGSGDSETPVRATSSRCRSARLDQDLPIFRARLRIRNDWKIPLDSQAQLGSTGALQDDAVKLRPGTSRSSLQSGDCIATLDREADLLDQIAVLTARVTQLTDQMARLVDETIEPALKRIAKQIETLEILLGTGEESSGLAATFKSLRNYVADLKAAADPQDIAQILDSVKTGTDDLARFSASLNQRTVVIEKTLAHLATIAESLELAIRENQPPLRQTIADSQYLLQELSESMVPILTHIEETTRHLSELSRELRNDPRSFFRSHETEQPPSWFQGE